MIYNNKKVNIKSFYDVNLDFLIENIKKFSKNKNIIDIKFSSLFSNEYGLYQFCLVIYENYNKVGTKFNKN